MNPFTIKWMRRGFPVILQSILRQTQGLDSGSFAELRGGWAVTASARQDIQPRLGSRLKNLRERKGLSRREVATRLKVDVTAVAAWERGTYQPRPAHRIAIANLLAADI